MARAKVTVRSRTRKDGNAKGIAIGKTKTVKQEDNQDKQTSKKQIVTVKKPKATKK